MSAQIAKLLPLLASNHDGEVVAAVRAIERLLKVSGQDWHDLARKVGEPELTILHERTWSTAPWPRASRAAEPHPEYRPRSPKPAKPNWDSLGRFAQISWLDRLLEQTWITKEEHAVCLDFKRKLHVGQLYYIEPHQKTLFTRLVNKAISLGVAI